MNVSALRWGFLGASRIGRSALAPAVLAAGQRLEAVAARDLVRAEAFAAAFGAGRAYGSYEALLCDSAIDAVYIALPNDLHLPWTLRALAEGKHVLCEKPLALTGAEVAQMQLAEQASGFRVMEAFCHRFHPQFDRARELLDQDAIGEILCAQTHFIGAIADPQDFRWTASQGGGALYDLGCYGVSMLRSLLSREPVAVHAIQTKHQDVDNRFAAQLDFDDGIAAQLFCSFDGTRHQSLRVIGSRASLEFDWPFSSKGRDTVLTCGGAQERFAPCDPYLAMVTHFAAAVLGMEPMRFGLSDSLAQARVIDALFVAARGTSGLS
jgi:xylose dehydrogenase (NAD/NADP)